MNEESTTPDPLSWNYIHWRTNDLIDVPPVLLATEFTSLRIRKKLAEFVDGRHANDVLYRAVIAIRKEYFLEPHAYVVAFPRELVELPIDIRPIEGENGRLVGIVKEPRSLREAPFDLTQLEGKLADHISTLPRDEAIRVLKQLSSDGQEYVVDDRCDHDWRFAHEFFAGTYRHRYRYVASAVPEVER